MPVLNRTQAFRYLVLFVLFWAVSAAGIITHSTSLTCGPTGCPTTPTYPGILAAGFIVGAALVTLAFGVTRGDRRRRGDPDALKAFLWFSLWWSVTATLMMFGFLIPEAVRVLRATR